MENPHTEIFISTNTMKYKIILNECIDEYDNITDSYYTVQIQKSFLWFKYWRTFKHTVSDMDYSYKEVTKFKTIEDAREFISILEKIKVMPIR
jgi:hypothetical protein